MTAYSPDATDWRILDVLQREGRATFAELARAVSMSASAVTERVRRLEEAGVIQGYAAVVDPDRLGLPILAFVRLRYPNGNYKPFHDLVAVTPEILEAHHVTGDDCFVIKVAARSMRHLEEVSGKIGTLGSVTTSVVYSSRSPGGLWGADLSLRPAVSASTPSAPSRPPAERGSAGAGRPHGSRCPRCGRAPAVSPGRRGPRPGSGRRGCRSPRR